MPWILILSGPDWFSDIGFVCLAGKKTRENTGRSWVQMIKTKSKESLRNPPILTEKIQKKHQLEWIFCELLDVENNSMTCWVRFCFFLIQIGGLVFFYPPKKLGLEMMEIP